MAEAPPIYLALDLWVALGLDSGEFDAYYERNGWANTWSNLLAKVRDLAGREPCLDVIDKVDLEAIADEWSDGGEDIGDERAWQVADALEAEVAFREALLSDENVERAAAGMWDRHGREGMFRYAPEHLRAAFKSDARAALRAAIEAALSVATESPNQEPGQPGNDGGERAGLVGREGPCSPLRGSAMATETPRSGESER